MGLEILLLVIQPMILLCDNSRVVTQSKEPRNHQKSKHIERKYHLIHEIVQRIDIVVEKIPSINERFTKTLIGIVFDGYKDSITIKYVPTML